MLVSCICDDLFFISLLYRCYEVWGRMVSGLIIDLNWIGVVVEDRVVFVEVELCGLFVGLFLMIGVIK